MVENFPPMPENELERIFGLAEFDLDYTNPENNFKDLVYLAARIAGTEMSLVSVIDSFTQWILGNYGLDIKQTPREETLCQYTISEKNYFEVSDLSKDERFKDKPYVIGPLSLRYYFGMPLTTSEGYNIGSLCVFDRNLRVLSPEKIELLKIVADEVVNRLKALKAIEGLKNQLNEAKETQKKVAHDIRGPIAGIIGLADLIVAQGDSNKLDEVLEFISLILKSGRSVLELADEILTEDKREIIKKGDFNLLIFKDKLEHLYQPQARNKNISFTVSINEKTEKVHFSKNKLLQITGNLISNAIKFTPDGGTVGIELDLVMEATFNILKIKVTDSGVGIDEKGITEILKGYAPSLEGTSGEKGYGFGLSLVKHLVEKLQGDFQIYSVVGKGTQFEITLRQQK